MQVQREKLFSTYVWRDGGCEAVPGEALKENAIRALQDKLHAHMPDLGGGKWCLYAVKEFFPWGSAFY